MYKPLCLVALFCLMNFLSGCKQLAKRNAHQYAIDSLLSNQAQYLAKHNGSITKVTRLEGEDNKVLLKPIDTTAWKKELEIFQVIDAINKPMNQDAYKIALHGDTRSNLQVKSYKTEKALSVKFVNFYYSGSIHMIRKIEAGYSESNSLYSSTRTVSMEFEQIRDTAVLTQYSILGGQKMFLDDSVQYNIKAYLSLGN